MTLKEAMFVRNSVRRYTDEPLKVNGVELLKNEINKINSESGLRFQLVTNEPSAFTGKMASYGHFSGCTDYIVAIGPKDKDEEIGYFGEKLVLFAQSIGINSCWVALTFNKSKVDFELNKGEKFYIVISLGYGVHQGRPHNNKPLSKLCNCENNMPDWFFDGMKGVLTAPTAMNQQKFYFELKDNNVVKAKSLLGPYSKMDLGIAKLHFELGAEDSSFIWE